MTRRRGIGGLGASPVLIGAVTTLVVIVAVFLAYNANSGLPFVPTYDLKADLPNAANLVVGNEVRIGGSRVGVVDKIEPARTRDGKSVAVISMKLENRIKELPVDSTVLVRPRSSLGLKYVQITPGSSEQGYDAGSTIPLRAARPTPVEIDEVFNTFDEKTRAGQRLSLKGFGDALTGRGADLNITIEELVPLFTYLEPVATNLADPDTHLSRFFKELGDAAEIVAPAAEDQADLFVNLDTTFTALSEVARPFLQDLISKSPPAEDTAIREFPKQRPFIQHSTALARDLRPGVAVLPDTVPDLADAVEIGTVTLRKTPPLNEDLEDVFRALERFAEDPLVPRGVHRLTDTVRSLKPTLAFITPSQTVCNYVTNNFKNVGSLLSEGDNNGTWQRFIIISAPAGPNSEGFPSSAPANGPTVDNHLHANPYPNTAGPGQTRECESGNEDYLKGKTVIGNLEGNQGTAHPGEPQPEEEGG
jgi:phospholipid/cholesterol/gamma-HCH transport system substrate-binding protein